MTVMIRTGTLWVATALMSTPLLAAGPQQANSQPEPKERPSAVSRDLPSLVAAERAFAAASKKNGMKAAFLANLAEDSVVFRPTPVDGRDWFESRPETPGTLLWEPEFARIASDFQLGFTSGPWEYRGEEGAEPLNGHYISVWRRDAGERWEVVADTGVTHAGGRKAPLTMVPAAAKRADDLEDAGRRKALAAMMEADRALGKISLEDGIRRHAIPEIRVYRDGLLPIVGTKDALAYAGGATERGAQDSMGGDVSPSGDLGYVYGVTRTESGGPSWVYLRIWARGHEGWRLVLDQANALPPETD